MAFIKFLFLCGLLLLSVQLSHAQDSPHPCDQFWLHAQKEDLAAALRDPKGIASHQQCKQRAEQGDSWAQYQLGRSYTLLDKTRTSYVEEGLNWLHRAAAQGSLPAQYLRGNIEILLYTQELKNPPTDNKNVQVHLALLRLTTAQLWFELLRRQRATAGTPDLEAWNASGEAKVFEVTSAALDLRLKELSKKPLGKKLISHYRTKLKPQIDAHFYQPHP